MTGIVVCSVLIAVGITTNLVVVSHAMAARRRLRAARRSALRSDRP